MTADTKRGALDLTYALVMAAGNDAANRAMRAAGRKAWSQSDFDVACELIDRLLPHAIDWYGPDTWWQK